VTHVEVQLQAIGCEYQVIAAIKSQRVDPLHPDSVIDKYFLGGQRVRWVPDSKARLHWDGYTRPECRQPPTTDLIKHAKKQPSGGIERHAIAARHLISMVYHLT